jgi:hypothetical protein
MRLAIMFVTVATLAVSCAGGRCSSPMASGTGGAGSTPSARTEPGPEAGCPEPDAGAPRPSRVWQCWCLEFEGGAEDTPNEQAPDLRDGAVFL